MMKIVFGIGSLYLVPPLLANTVHIGTEKKDYERGNEVDIVAVLADEEHGGRSQL